MGVQQRFLLKNSSMRKINLVQIPFIVTFLIILGVSLYANLFISFSMRTMEYNIEHRLVAESKRLASIVSAQELDKYQVIADMELPEYKALRLRLLDFSRDADILYAYFIRPLKDEFQYIVDNDFNEETRVGLDTPTFDPRPLPWILSTLEGKAVCSGLGNYTPGWEGLLSGYAPVFNIDGKVTAIAGIDLEANSLDVIRHGLTITIRDDGNGIEPDMLPHIFERGKGKKSGSGLGLPICREIARRHGGDIAINSEQGKGTTVTVKLPVIEQQGTINSTPFKVCGTSTEPVGRRFPS